MTYKNDDFDYTYESRAERHAAAAEWKSKFTRFLRYLSTRKMECWGFFAAGFLIATIF